MNSQPVCLLSQLRATARVSVMSLLSVHVFLSGCHMTELFPGTANPRAPSPACVFAATGFKVPQGCKEPQKSHAQESRLTQHLFLYVIEDLSPAAGNATSLCYT